jgi:hypothetical protein
MAVLIRGNVMGREQDDSEQFEWVNAWASLTKAEAASMDAAGAAVAAAVERPVVARVVAPGAKLPDDQLMRDIAEIERARDALATIPVNAKRRMQALTLIPARTTDPVPVVVGGVLALVMLTVFGAAAAMTKLAR